MYVQLLKSTPWHLCCVWLGWERQFARFHCCPSSRLRTRRWVHCHCHCLSAHWCPRRCRSRCLDDWRRCPTTNCGRCCCCTTGASDCSWRHTCVRRPRRPAPRCAPPAAALPVARIRSGRPSTPRLTCARCFSRECTSVPSLGILAILRMWSCWLMAGNRFDHASWNQNKKINVIGLVRYR